MIATNVRIEALTQLLVEKGILTFEEIYIVFCYVKKQILNVFKTGYLTD